MDKKKEVLLRTNTSKDKPQVIDLSGHLSSGFLALFFFNCNEGSKVSFDVEVHEYNELGGVRVCTQTLFAVVAHLWLHKLASTS